LNQGVHADSNAVPDPDLTGGEAALFAVIASLSLDNEAAARNRRSTCNADVFRYANRPLGDYLDVGADARVRSNFDSADFRLDHGAPVDDHSLAEYDAFVASTTTVEQDIIIDDDSIPEPYSLWVSDSDSAAEYDSFADLWEESRPHHFSKKQAQGSWNRAQERSEKLVSDQRNERGMGQNQASVSLPWRARPAEKPVADEVLVVQGLSVMSFH